MILDGMFAFGIPAITDSTTATVSTNVLDAGSAVILFGARSGLRLWFRATVAADANPTIMVDLVAADNAALSSNPIVLASSGVISTKDGLATALATGDTVERSIPIPSVQRVAKRYYGLMVKLGGTNPDTTAQTTAYIVADAQTNMVGARAAIPA